RDDADGLVMSPNEAIDTVANYLTDPDADAPVAESQWIEQIHEYQAELEEEHGEHDTEVSITRTVFDDSVNTVRLQDGSALVFGAMNALESLTPDEDATVTLTDLTREIGEFGSAEAEDQVRIRYRNSLPCMCQPMVKFRWLGMRLHSLRLSDPAARLDCKATSDV